MWQLPYLSRQVYWLVGGLIFVTVGAVAYQYLLAQPVPIWSQTSAQPKPISPVYLRLGTIVSLQQSSFKLSTPQLSGSGSEVITIKLAPITKVIEIRVPAVITPTHEKTLKTGGRVIERVEVKADKLTVGQEVAVVGLSDMSGAAEVEAERVEYQVLVE